MRESWDLYDACRRPLGRQIFRGQPIPSGAHILVCEVWTVNPRGQVLITLRAPEKEAYPNKWESTGGAAVAGEGSLDAAIRELREETGIQAKQHQLHLLHSDVNDTSILDSYMCLQDMDISQMTMQAGETVAARWVWPDELYSMARDETLARPVGRRLLRMQHKFEEVMAGLVASPNNL